MDQQIGCTPKSFKGLNKTSHNFRYKLTKFLVLRIDYLHASYIKQI